MILCSILNDDEHKHQILQIELVYPEHSFIGLILQRFKRILLLETEREARPDALHHLSPLQLFFSFVVLLSQSESVFKKYCFVITEIVYTYIKWSLDTNLDSTSYILHVCNLIFSVINRFFSFILESNTVSLLQQRPYKSYLFHAHCIYQVNKPLFYEYREHDPSTPFTSDILHCLFEYWQNSLLTTDRTDVSSLLEDYFSLFPQYISTTNRLSYFLCLSSFSKQFALSFFLHSLAFLQIPPSSSTSIRRVSLSKY